jgi:uncharacterized protein (DUF1330 family)
MSVYAFFSYDVHDQERFAQYSPGNQPTIMACIDRHGGKIVFAGGPEIYQDGTPRQHNVCIQFPSAEAVQGLMADPEYAAVAVHRTESTHNYTIFLAPEFVPPQ